VPARGKKARKAVQAVVAVGHYLNPSPIFKIDSLESDDVRRYLLAKHRTWRIPERRVRKFVKRQTGNDTDSVMTEDSTMSVTSVRSRSVMGAVGDAAGRLFGTSVRRRKRWETDVVPVFEIQTTRSLLSQLGTEFEIPETEDDDVLSPIREAQTPLYTLDTNPISPDDANRTVASDLDTPRVVLAERFLFDDNDNEKEAISKENGATTAAITPAESSTNGAFRDLYHDDNDGKRDNRCVCEGCIIV
jgi:hypothetical protein